MPDQITRTVPDRLLATTAAVVALALALMVPFATRAADHDLEEALAAMQVATQARIEDLNAALDSSAVGLADEAFLMGPRHENFADIASALGGYADGLEALDAPGPMAADVERHASALRELSTTLLSGAEAAAAGDRSGVDAAEDAMASLLARLAGELTPAYAELAFVTPVDYDFLGVFGALDEEDRAYLDGVLEAMDEWDRRLAVFQGVMGEQYASPEALLAALYDAGAGEAWAAVETKARTLSPSPRFEDEHAWWLDRLAVLAEVDGRIGEAMRDGDIARFAADNIRLGLVTGPYPGLDASFGAVVDSDSPLALRLDPAALSADDATYLQALFDALRGPGSVGVFAGIGWALFELPGTTDELAMAAIDATGAEMRAALDELEASVSSLQPPEHLAIDHALITTYLDTAGAALDAIIAASAAGDADAVLDAFRAFEDGYCSTAESLGDEVEPASSAYFDPAAFVCRE